MLNDLVVLLVQLVRALGPWGPLLAALVDSSLLPLAPGVDVLIAAHSLNDPHTAYLGAALAVAGSVGGSWILYEAGRRGGRFLVRKRSWTAAVEQAKERLERFGPVALLVPAVLPLPLPLKVFVVASGAVDMRLGRFVTTLAVARGVRYVTVAFLALEYGGTAIEFLR